jgi:hypothetical protein
MRTAARRPPPDDAAHSRPRGKPSAYVDSDGYVYQTRQGGGTAYALIFGLLCMLIGAFGIMWRLNIPYEEAIAPLPTAGVATKTAPSVRVNLEQPYSAPASPAYEQAITAYNAAQEERAAEYAQEATQEAPSAAGAVPADNHEAAINAWLAAPVSTATPLPEPGAPGFAESFEEAPQCSPFIGYLPGDPCVEILKQQAGED